MTSARKITVAAAAISACLMLSDLVNIPAYAQTQDQRWCQIDDPATFHALRAKLAAEGAKDDSALQCPARKAADGGVPATLHMPMPCGRTMLFQRVDVPVEHLLDQVVGSFGRQVDGQNETVQILLSSGAWQSPVAGGFTVSVDGPDGTTEAMSKPKFRSYYIARYETTEPQAMLWNMGLLGADGPGTAVDAPGCEEYATASSKLNTRKILAEGDFSWFDGIDFARDYTEWLLAQDQARLDAGKKPFLPWEQGSTGIIRLPSEAEWEYAARGGSAAVSEQARSISLPRIIDPNSGEIRSADLEEICADPPRKPQDNSATIGRKAPNLIGLYDVLCNVEEVVLDLFRMTRPDGLHGQIGGYVTKGGTSKNQRNRNTIGMRVEKEHFRLNGAQSVPTVGVRLAIGPPAFVGRRGSSDAYEEGLPNEPLNLALKSAYEDLIAAGVGPGRADRQTLDRELAELQDQLKAKDLDRQALQDQLARLQGTVQALNTELNEVARTNARQMIRAGVVSSNLIERIGRNMYAVLQDRADLLANQQVKGENRKMLEDLKAWQVRMDRNKTRIEATFDLYLSIHLELTQQSENFVAERIAAAKAGLRGASLQTFGEDLDLFKAHQRETREARGAITESMRNRWIFELDEVRKLRDDKFPDFR